MSNKYIYWTSVFVPIFLSNLSFLTGNAVDGLKGRVFEVSLADLQNDEVAFRKFKLIVEEVQAKNCLTNFHGMDMTTDKLRSLVKKWQVGPVFVDGCTVFKIHRTSRNPEKYFIVKIILRGASSLAPGCKMKNNSTLVKSN